MFSFAAVAVTFLSPVFTLKVRWAILLASVAGFSLQRGFLAPTRRGAVQLAVVFAVWGSASTLWSEIWQLSLLKSGANFLVIFAGISGGALWVRTHPPNQFLSFLVPLFVITALSGIFGAYSSEAILDSGSAVMYQGLVAGPNMFGSMVAMCSPFLILQVTKERKKFEVTMSWAFVAAVFAVFLVLSRSRSAALVVLCYLAGVIWCISPRRRFQVVIIGVWLVSFGLVASTDLGRSLTAFIYKTKETNVGIFSTRTSVWNESLELAQKGGLLGGGYGVTIGDSRFRTGLSELTAIGYGREKGNSQLAIMEELGYVGLGIYALLLLSLLTCIQGAYRAAGSREAKKAVGLMGGGIIGQTLQSIFEAWWVAPGSPECMFFWVSVGVLVGLSMDPRIRARAVSPAERNAIIENPKFAKGV